jgi:hypothetical protein
MTSAPARAVWCVAAVACGVLAGCTHGGLPVSADGNNGVQRPAHVATGVIGTRQAAELDLVNGASAVVIDSADLHGGLYQASTPSNANEAPSVTMDGDTVEVGMASTGQSGPATVHIVLSSKVRWRIELDGGATSETVRLPDALLTELDFGAGSSRIDATLPRPVGTVPVRMTGGTASFALHLPAGVPAQVRFAGGAGSATIDGTDHTGLAGGTVFSPQGWTGAANRYDIDNTAGVSNLVLDRALSR